MWRGFLDLFQCSSCCSQSPYADGCETEADMTKNYNSTYVNWTSAGFDHLKRAANDQDFSSLLNTSAADPSSTGMEYPDDDPSSKRTYTPRQRELYDKSELPELTTYPAPPGHPNAEELTDATKKVLLQKLFKDFIVDMNTGMFLSQYTSTREKTVTHCQLMDDCRTLKMDQNTGRLIEFPLQGVKHIYVVVRAVSPSVHERSSICRLSNNQKNLDGSDYEVEEGYEYIVVVVFERRKLAFAFDDRIRADRFQLCMQMLAKKVEAKENDGILASPRTPSLPITPRVCKNVNTQD